MIVPTSVATIASVHQRKDWKSPESRCRANTLPMNGIENPTTNLSLAIMRFGLLVVWLSCPRVAMAYRPFVSTDAAVTDKGVSEVDLGLVDFANYRGQNTLTAPALRYNLGFAKNWEVAVEGALQVFDSASG